ncbi:ABC transporter permease [Rhizobiaceae bacterium n13]|uniref:ABC transporter permease n=1 Tax=Ferirhizobium litorale TaxID=2927786 RepID=A0AAE3QDD6_9HYPH|nr:ABC transporter permease [Fererhizobium litorale]MDI7861885.1 ABC transporter permease [Fererhizobium litorale]MDI7921773.1 ABC transporter permease [Fererhizobium litorale]
MSVRPTVLPGDKRTSVARSSKLVAGLVITGVLCAIALVSLVWTPLPPTKIQIAYKLTAPLQQGLLGTDQLGRDVLSMVMVGAWNSLSTAVAAVAIGGSLGTVAGLFAAAARGTPEALAMRACDIVFALPPILSAMMLGAFLGTGRWTAIIAIAVFMIPVFARVVCGAARQIWPRDYIQAARGAGKGPMLISIEHVLPNISSQIIVQVTIQLGLAILTEASLSFLGLGMPPPSPTWGRMLADSQTYLAQAPWLAVAPGLAIALAVFGLNMLGDGLRDTLDPRTPLLR